LKQGTALLTCAGTLYFITTWLILSFTTNNYSPRREPISELARLGRSTHGAMTAAIVIFSVSTLLFGLAIINFNKMGGVLMIVHGLGGIGVAAIPLGFYNSDASHQLFAGIVYVTTGIYPLVATVDAVGHKRLARASFGIIVASLLISAFGPTATCG